MRYSVARPVCVTSEIVLGNLIIILLLGSLRASACHFLLLIKIKPFVSIDLLKTLKTFEISKCYRIILKVHLRLKYIPPCKMAKQEMPSTNMN